jgi:uncharacterized membrane protein (DUF106 family)
VIQMEAFHLSEIQTLKEDHSKEIALFREEFQQMKNEMKEFKAQMQETKKENDKKDHVKIATQNLLKALQQTL